MKKTNLMISLLIGLTFTLTYGNVYPLTYDNIPVGNPVYIENIVMEPELELEKWMLEFFIVDPLAEPEIEVEDWMINMDKFYAGDQIHEEQLKLENWMFEIPFELTSREQKLVLEN